MKPRVFVSSTYYDLKHVRERIEKFIDNYGFESVLFESDKITYEHGRNIDVSAYNEVALCHLMILIVGGRYGTISSIADHAEEQKRYESEYISITRKEFEMALKKDIPIFIFIDKSVYSEYQTYKENQDFFENNETPIKATSVNESKFKFAHVDSVNVFRFIDFIKTNPIKTFDRVEEIETYLQNQLAGMFYLYLDGLQKQTEVRKVLDMVNELNLVSNKMDEMLTSVGKKILGHDGNDEYESVIKKQYEMIIDFFADQISPLFSWEVMEDHSGEISDYQMTEVSKLIFEIVLNTTIKNTEGGLRQRIDVFNKMTMDILNQALEQRNIPVKFSKIHAYRMNQIYRNKVQPFANGEENKNKLIDRIKADLELY